jgi:hypothetical protein
VSFFLFHRYRIWPLAGYWTPSEESGYVVKCEPPEACLGSPDGNILATNGSNAICAPNYTGVRCGECIDGYYKEAGMGNRN